MTTNQQIFDVKRQTADGLVVKVVYGCTVQLENFIDRITLFLSRNRLGKNNIIHI